MRPAATRLLVLLAALSACRGEFRRQAEALDAYDRGRKLLEEGRPSEAAVELAEAARLDPESPSLAAWQAKAMAASGDPGGAAALLGGVVESGKADLACAYNHAAYLARAGRTDEALKALKLLLEANPESGSKVLAGPDFTSLRDVPEFAAILRLPEPVVTMRGEAGRILAGENYDLALDAQGPAGTALRVAWEGDALEGFVPVRIVGDREMKGDFQLRHLAYAFRAFEAGSGQLGPWAVSFGAQSAVVPAVAWEVVAPTGMTIPRAPAGRIPIEKAWLVPRDLFEGRTSPSAALAQGWLVVLAAQGDQIVAGPAGLVPIPVQLELRDGERTQERGAAWLLDGSGQAVHVRIERQGTVLYEGDLTE
jgi:hypothetical protein